MDNDFISDQLDNLETQLEVGGIEATNFGVREAVGTAALAGAAGYGAYRYGKAAVKGYKANKKMPEPLRARGNVSEGVRSAKQKVKADVRALKKGARSKWQAIVKKIARKGKG